MAWGSLGKSNPRARSSLAAKGGIKYIYGSSGLHTTLPERAKNDFGHARRQHLAHFALIAITTALEAGIINRPLQDACAAATTRP